jgi:radical SAM protein (TIGR01212 family)
LPGGNSISVPLEEQLEQGITRGVARYGKGTKFLAYFQTGTNTNAPLDELKKIYDAPLKYPEIIGIDIGTRPDCVDPSVLMLISSYSGKYGEIWVELGLQSSSNDTLKIINRGHTVQEFDKAAAAVKEAGLKLAVHIIAGFPWEEPGQPVESAKHACKMGADALKIHPLHIIKGTRLAEKYETDRFKLFSLEEYVNVVADIIGKIPRDTVIMRFTAETAKDRLIAPEYCVSEYKSRIKEMVIKELEKRQLNA